MRWLKLLVLCVPVAMVGCGGKPDQLPPGVEPDTSALEIDGGVEAPAGCDGRPGGRPSKRVCPRCRVKDGGRPERRCSRQLNDRARFGQRVGGSGDPPTTTGPAHNENQGPVAGRSPDRPADQKVAQSRTVV